MIKAIYKKVVPENVRLKTRLSINKLSSVLYKGDKLHCNVCNRSFSKFKPKGNWSIRENAECPYCGSLERTRTLLFYLRNETDIFSSLQRSLLHFAPEWGLVPVFRKQKNLQYITADINPDYADEQIDITDIPYPDNTYDYIICSHVLGHVPDEGKAIRELKRVLKPGGSAFVLTLIDWNNSVTYESSEVKTASERLKNYSEPDLLRLHGSDFSQRLESGGLKVEVIDYRTILGEEKQRLFSLGDGNREVIFKCTK